MHQWLPSVLRVFLQQLCSAVHAVSAVCDSRGMHPILHNAPLVQSCTSCQGRLRAGLNVSPDLHVEGATARS